MATNAAVRAARRRTSARLDGIPSLSPAASSACFRDLLHRSSEVAAGAAKARGDGAAQVLWQQHEQQQHQQQRRLQLQQQNQQQGLRRGASSLDSCGASPNTVGREAVVGDGVGAREGGAWQRGRGARTDEGSRRDADPSAAHEGGAWPLSPGIPARGQRSAGWLRPHLALLPGDCVHLGPSRGQSASQSTATSADCCHPSSWQLPRQLHHGSTVGRMVWDASFPTKRQTHLLDQMAPSTLASFLRTATAALRQLSSSSFSEPTSGLLALNSLGPNEGAIRVPKRVGRGIGSGKGKTAGRGHKGQKSRSGNKPRVGFEGGQTPLRLRLPKRGFHNPFSSDFQVVNLKDVVAKITEGKIDPSSLITMKTLKDAGMGGKAMRDGIKLLARGAETITMPLHFEVSRVSEDARKAVEAAGGTVTRVHYNELGLRALLKPEWFAKKGRPLPKAARPPPRIVRLGAVDAVGRLPAPTVPMPMKLGRLVEGWGEGLEGKAEVL